MGLLINHSLKGLWLALAVVLLCREGIGASLGPQRNNSQQNHPPETAVAAVSGVSPLLVDAALTLIGETAGGKNGNWQFTAGLLSNKDKFLPFPPMMDAARPMMSMMHKPSFSAMPKPKPQITPQIVSQITPEKDQGKMPLIPLAPPKPESESANSAPQQPAMTETEQVTVFENEDTTPDVMDNQPPSDTSSAIITFPDDLTDNQSTLDTLPSEITFPDLVANQPVLDSSSENVPLDLLDIQPTSLSSINDNPLDSLPPPPLPVFTDDILPSTLDSPVPPPSIAVEESANSESAEEIPEELAETQPAPDFSPDPSAPTSSALEELLATTVVEEESPKPEQVPPQVLATPAAPPAKPSTNSSAVGGHHHQNAQGTGFGNQLLSLNLNGNQANIAHSSNVDMSVASGGGSNSNHHYFGNRFPPAHAHGSKYQHHQGTTNSQGITSHKVKLRNSGTQ